MHSKNSLPLVLALCHGAIAQITQTSITDALNSHNDSLSGLNALLNSQPAIVQALGGLNNVTLLAPNNDALSAYLNNSGSGAMSTDRIAALLNYHVLDGIYYASNITNTSAFVPTSLTNRTYTNVTDGQVVEAVFRNNNVTFFSGLGENSTVVTPNVNFTGGTIHIIDRVLNIPGMVNTTLLAAGLTAAAGALNQTGLAQNVSSLRDVTIFAPSNQAFANIGNLVSSLTTDQLASILSYHVVEGDVSYSTDLENGTIRALNGQDLRIEVDNETVYVNSAKVIQANILVENGVIHVIDNVLNPQNSTATPNPTASTQAPAFSGASSASQVPFTSGQPTPSTTAPIATGANTATSTGLAVPMKTGALGVAALFGGAVVMVNL